MCSSTVLGSETVSLKPPWLRVGQVDCGLWNAGRLPFKGCETLLDIDRNLYTPILIFQFSLRHMAGKNKGLGFYILVPSVCLLTLHGGVRVCLPVHVGDC